MTSCYFLQITCFLAHQRYGLKPHRVQPPWATNQSKCLRLRVWTQPANYTGGRQISCETILGCNNTDHVTCGMESMKVHLMCFDSLEIVLNFLWPAGSDTPVDVMLRVIMLSVYVLSIRRETRRLLVILFVFCLSVSKLSSLYSISFLYFIIM